jgi:hypothetical protein
LYVFDLDQGNVYKEKGLVSEFNEMMQKAFSKLASERKKEASESYRIAVMMPFSPGGPTRDQLLGGRIYKSILEQPRFTITHADEPADPSARATLNRGGDWPFPPANVDPKKIWQGTNISATPNVEQLYLAGQDLGADALVMWHYKPKTYLWEWPVQMYVIDVEKQRVYLRKGVNTEADALVRQALDDFRAGREP